MFDIEQLNTSFDFTATVIFANGHQSVFHKEEHICAKRVKDYYDFTFQGSSNESINNKAPEEWDDIVLQFGKALYPLSLKVSEQGELTGVRDFEKVKDHWFAKRQEIIDYYNSYLIEKESNRYALALMSEEKFSNIIKKNMFYRLLFWQDELSSQEIEIRDFPARARLAIFSFQGGRREREYLCYDTSHVHDEGSGRLLSGRCTLRIRRDADGLPGEISLKARVEEQDTGYFIKEITIRRL